MRMRISLSPSTLQFALGIYRGSRGQKRCHEATIPQPVENAVGCFWKKRAIEQSLAANQGKDLSSSCPPLAFAHAFLTTRRVVSAALFQASRVTMSILPILPIGISNPQGEFSPPPKETHMFLIIKGGKLDCRPNGT